MSRQNKLASLIQASFLIASATLLTGISQAALSITPPQLAPDQRGVIATEVKSGLAVASRWSVRVVEWVPEPSQALAVLATPIASPHHQDMKPQPLAIEISPRFFSLAPSGKQVIRARVSDRSKHYRLLIEQIPEAASTGQGVNFRFRFSLPVYQSPEDPLIPHGIVIH